MTKEWQEATNEYLKVGITLELPSRYRRTVADAAPSTAPKLGPVDGHLVRRLLGQGRRAVALGQAIKQIRFSLSIDAGSLVICGSERDVWEMAGHQGFIGGRTDIGWCKYCTTLTMRLVSLPLKQSRLSGARGRATLHRLMP
jgi:hypothetical protein